MQKMSYF